MATMDKLKPSILQDVLEALGLEDGDPKEKRSALLERINGMSPEAIFKRYCDWNGLVGWGSRLMEEIDNVRAACKEEEEEETKEKGAELSFKPFDKTDYDCWSGVSSPNPLLGQYEGVVAGKKLSYAVILDGPFVEVDLTENEDWDAQQIWIKTVPDSRLFGELVLNKVGPLTPALLHVLGFTRV